MYRYLIYHDQKAFYTDWFEFENHYLPGMVVFDLMRAMFTNDGNQWQDITQDHL